MENKVWYLRQNRLFRRAAEDDIAKFAESFTQMVYPKRSLIFDVGDPSHNVYLLKSGNVRLSRVTKDGKEVSLAMLGPGDLFGEEMLFETPTRTTVARCVDDAFVCSTRAQDLFKILAVNPILALNVAKYLSERLETAQATVEDIAALQVPDRIVNLFERLAQDYGVSIPDGTKINVHLTHADIASMVGSTRETVSLELGRLAKAGKVRINRSEIVLLAASPLKHAAVAR